MHAVAIAAPEGSPDAGVAWHYGDPLGEQRLLDRGEGVVDLSHRPVVEVSGDDRLSWLHTLTSQHVRSCRPGEWTQALDPGRQWTRRASPHDG